MTKPSLLNLYPKKHRLPYGPYACVVDYVHDADTVIVAVDLGLRNYPTVAVRLKDVHAAELSEDGGKELTDYVKMLFPKGAAMKLYTEEMDKSENWSFERVVGKFFNLSNENMNVIIQNFIDNSGYGPGNI